MIAFWWWHQVFLVLIHLRVMNFWLDHIFGWCINFENWLLHLSVLNILALKLSISKALPDDLRILVILGAYDLFIFGAFLLRNIVITVVAVVLNWLDMMIWNFDECTTRFHELHPPV